MSEWTSGYVADIDYTYGYYQELNPHRSKFGLNFSGFHSPKIETACELGFGQGMSVNLHAAATETEWWGTDFNPAQAGFAKELAQVSGARANVFDESFSEFCNRKDLPEFDFIGLHGIWSWISDANRIEIRDFVRKKLRVGGVLYISYNTYPGWSGFAPMRHLLTQHAELMSSGGSGIVNRIDGAMKFAEQFLDTNPLYKRASPNVEDRIKKMSEQNRHYLAHEYFNKDWHPMHFASVAELLAQSKVDFACSANFLDLFNSVNLTTEQREFYKTIPEGIFKQSVRDFMINQAFRRDYWIRGLRKLNKNEQAQSLTTQKVVLTTPVKDISLKISGGQGEVDMSKAIYEPVLEALGDHKILSIAEIHGRAHQINTDITLPVALEAVMILAGAGHLTSVEQDPTAKTIEQCRNINRHIIGKAHGSAEIGHLASPVISGGFPVSRIDQLFIESQESGAKSEGQLAEFAWKVLKSGDQTLIKDGKPLKTEQENVAELTSKAGDYLSYREPVLKSLRIRE